MRRAERGFTLMEILVAIFVLAIGLAGVLAVFPAGIKMGTETVKDSYTGIVTQSVLDAFQVCLRENRYTDPESGHPYIIFDHDGVLEDTATHNPSKPDYTKDYIILLPQYFKSDEQRTFVYPETSAIPNGNGSNATAEDDSKRVVKDRYDLDRLEITRTYELGQFIRKRLEDPEVSKAEKDILAEDPYPQYSYSLIISRGKTDTNGNGAIDEADKYSNFLFVVQVNIYRNFKPDPKLRWNDPIHSMTMQVEM